MPPPDLELSRELLGQLLASDNPQVVALAGALPNAFDILNSQVGLINASAANAQAQQGIAAQQQAIAQERLGQAAEQSGVVAQKLADDTANANADLALNRQGLFFDRGLNYRQLANNFATAGLGDSGFANRARRELATTTQLSDDKLQLQFKKALDAINSQSQSNQIAIQGQESDARALAANAASQALSAKDRLIGLEGQALDVQKSKLDLIANAISAGAQRAPINRSGVGTSQ